ncbi:hypothetical protein SCLCIDRAFT_12395, partial [Scleroderma citrinum Foug A]
MVCVMDSATFLARTLSATLQYTGIRFRWIMHALQQKGNDSLWEKINWYSHVQAEVALLEHLLAACNKEGLVIQVPAVAAQVLEWVSVQEPDVQTLMCQIKTINVLK